MADIINQSGYADDKPEDDSGLNGAGVGDISQSENGDTIRDSAGRFVTGHPGHPRGGRKRGQGATIRDYLSSWSDADSRMTFAELRRIRRDKTEPQARRMAAELMLQGTSCKTDRSRREAIAEVMDRTTGKAVAKSEITHLDGRDPAERAADVLLKLAAITGRPALVDAAKTPVIQAQLVDEGNRSVERSNEGAMMDEGGGKTKGRSLPPSESRSTDDNGGI